MHFLPHTQVQAPGQWQCGLFLCGVYAWDCPLAGWFPECTDGAGLEQQLAAMGISVPQRWESRGLTEVLRPPPVLAIWWTLVMAWIVCYIVRDWADGRSWGTCIQVGVWAVVLLLPIPWLMLHFLRLRKEPFHIYTPEDNQ